MAENSIAKGNEELWAATAKAHQNAYTGPAVTPATEDDNQALPSDEKVVDATAPSGPVLRKPGGGGYRNLSVEEATEKFWVLAKQIEDASEEPDSGGSDDEAGDPIGDVVDVHGPGELDVDPSGDSSSGSLIDGAAGSVSAEEAPIQEDAEQVVAVPADHSNAEVGGSAVVPDLADSVSQEPTSSSVATAVSPVTEWVLDEQPSVTTPVVQQPSSLPKGVTLFLGHDGQAYIEVRDRGNPYAVRLASRNGQAIMAALFASEGNPLRPADLRDVSENAQGWVQQYGQKREVWSRVAPIDGGVEIDVGDDLHTRIRISAGRVELVTSGSQILFYRSPNAKSMAPIAPRGDLHLLRSYVNLSPAEYKLLVAWLSYTLAHPKVPGTSYVILVLQGSQGTGKTSLCENLIVPLIDPSLIGVQKMPKVEKDLTIALHGAQVACFDNVRGFKTDISDLFCIAATGGKVVARKLYSDADPHVMSIHGALVLNGIHSFVNQSDLAQRCLVLHLQPILESMRRSPVQMLKALADDLPKIRRGLLDLIAAILKELPTVEVTHPERILDFVRWLAAMERVDGVPAGVYQAQYSDTLSQGQLDSLLDNVLAAAIVDFADKVFKNEASWSGTPAELLSELEGPVNLNTMRSRDWPSNPIALSKRLVGLEASLLTQGIKVERTRGKERVITITKVGGRHE